MRFVVGTPQEHSIFNNDDGDDDDAVVCMSSSPVRRGSSWIVAAVTQRMRFIVFSVERSSCWSRRIIGQLPVAAGAVTEGRLNSNMMTNIINNNNNSTTSARPDNKLMMSSSSSSSSSSRPSSTNDLASASASSSQQQQQQQQKQKEQQKSSSFASPPSSSSAPSGNDEILRIVESPISIHFHQKGRRIVIATTVRRLLILEIDAEQGNDTTPLAHELSDESQFLFGNANLPSASRFSNFSANSASTNNSNSDKIRLSAPLPNMQSRWCVVCEVFTPQGLIQSVDTSCGGNIFSVCSSSGHIFVVSWLNGSVLHEIPVVDASLSSNVVKRRYLNNITVSPKLRVGAVSFLDGSVSVVGPKLKGCGDSGSSTKKAKREIEPNDGDDGDGDDGDEDVGDDDESCGASLPLDLSLSELQLAMIGHCSPQQDETRNISRQFQNINNNSSASGQVFQSASSCSSSSSSLPASIAPTPTSGARSSFSISTIAGTASSPSSSPLHQHDAFSIIKFLSFNNKYKTLAFCGARLSTFNIIDISSVAGDPNSFVKVPSNASSTGDQQQPKKKQQQQQQQQHSTSSSSSVGTPQNQVLLLPPFHNLAQSIRNTLFEISPASTSYKHKYSSSLSSQHSATFRQLGFGELKSLSWSPDEEALCLCFSHAGICVFDVSGVLLFHSWKNSNNNNNNNNNNSCQTDEVDRPLLPIGALSSLWIDSKRIIALDRFGTKVTKFELAAASIDHFTPENETDGNAVLVGPDAVWQYRAPKLVNDYLTVQHNNSHHLNNNNNSSNNNDDSKSGSSSCMKSSLGATTSPSVWEKIQVPEAYIGRNYPLRFAVASPDGSKVIICGRRGFVLWNNQTQRWKTFLDHNLHATSSANGIASSSSASSLSSPSSIVAQQEHRICLEQSFAVTASPTWIGNEVVAVPCEMTNAVAGKSTSCKLGTAGEGAVLLFSAHFTQALDYNNDEKKKVNTVKNSSLLEMLSFGDSARPLLVSCSYRGGAGVENGSRSAAAAKVFTSTSNHSYILSILNAHGGLSFYNVSTLLVANDVYDQVHSNSSNSQNPGCRLYSLASSKDPCFSVKIRLTSLQSLLRLANGNLIGVPFITKDQAVGVAEKAAAATKSFAEKHRQQEQLQKEQDERKETGKEKEKDNEKTAAATPSPQPPPPPPLSLEQLKAKAYSAAIGHMLKKLQTSDAFFVAQPSDVKQMFCFAPYLGLVPSGLAAQSHPTTARMQHDVSNISTFFPNNFSFYLVILLNCGRILLLDVGNRANTSMFATDHGVIFGEIINAKASSSSSSSSSSSTAGRSSLDLFSSSSPSSFVTRMWPAFVSQTTEAKPIEVLLTFGSDGLCGKSFIVSSRQSIEAYSSAAVAAAQQVFATISPTLFSVFRSHVDLSPFDSESIPIGVCGGSMPIWAAPKRDDAFSSPLTAGRWLPSFDVSVQLSIALHLTVLLPLLVGNFNFALLKSKSTPTTTYSSSSASPSKAVDDVGEDILEILRALSAQFKRQKSLIESFDCALYQILHANMHELVDVGSSSSSSSSPFAHPPDRRQILHQAITFLRAECSSQDFFDICVLTLRKTDEARCGPLFDVLGPPHEMFDHCVVNNHLLSALHLLRVIQMYSDYQQRNSNNINDKNNNNNNNNNIHHNSNNNNGLFAAASRVVEECTAKQHQQQHHGMMKTVIADSSVLYQQHHQQQNPLIHCYNSAKRLFGRVLRQYDQSVAIDLLRYLVLIQNELVFINERQLQVAAAATTSASGDQRQQQQQQQRNMRKSSFRSASESNAASEDETLSLVKLPSVCSSSSSSANYSRKAKEIVIESQQQQSQPGKGEGGGVLSTVTSALWSIFTFGGASSTGATAATSAGSSSTVSGDAAGPNQGTSGTTSRPEKSPSSNPKTEVTSVGADDDDDDDGKSRSRLPPATLKSKSASGAQHHRHLGHLSSTSSPSASSSYSSSPLDAPPAAVLLANDDLIDEVLDVAESFLSYDDGENNSTSNNNNSTNASILRVFALFDGFGLDANIFFEKRYAKIEKQMMTASTNYPYYLSFTLGSLLTELDLPDAEFVAKRLAFSAPSVSCSSSTDLVLLDSPTQIRKTILTNELGIVTPTQLALLERTPAFLSLIVLRMRNIFAQNKCTVYLLMMDLILMNVGGIRRTFSGQNSSDILKQSFVKMISEEAVCAGYRSILEKI